MRLLHEVIDDLHHHAEEHAITPLGHVLEELLGGERGTLHDLADRFTQAGMPSAELLERLCRLLPPMVHAMTPEGQLEGELHA